MRPRSLSFFVVLACSFAWTQDAVEVSASPQDFLRALGVDLQKEVHEDMVQNFSIYPQRWKWISGKPDSNIDHRRVPNLMVFFGRKAEQLPTSTRAQDYRPGDLVTYDLGGNVPHIGIVVDRKGASGRYMIEHNIGQGPGSRMCYSVGKSLVTIATTGRHPESGEILSKNYLPIIVPCSAIRYHWPSRFTKTSVWRVRRVFTWPFSRAEVVNSALETAVSP
jgi:hypothetical protein